MTAPARPFNADTLPGEAIIVGAEISGGHEGTAEMVVSVQFENGVISPVILDADTGMDLMRSCGAASLGGLIGRPWRDILKGL